MAVTPPLIFTSFAAMGAGHGSYLPALLMFPVGVLVWFLGAEIGLGDLSVLIGLVLAVVQFPFYGYLIGLWLSGKRSARYPLVALLGHVVILTLLFFVEGI